MRFAAIDFETADYKRDSACAVAIVIADGSQVIERAEYLIRPPRRRMVFSYLHGITWEQVEGQPSFAELWPEIAPRLDGVEFIAAHNAPFDAGVLRACCAAAGLDTPPAGFVCTVRVARDTWNIFPTKLPDVCRHLGIALRHHDAGSDAEACARIVISAAAAGADLRRYRSAGRQRKAV